MEQIALFNKINFFVKSYLKFQKNCLSYQKNYEKLFYLIVKNSNSRNVGKSTDHLYDSIKVSKRDKRGSEMQRKDLLLKINIVREFIMQLKKHIMQGNMSKKFRQKFLVEIIMLLYSNCFSAQMCRCCYMIFKNYQLWFFVLFEPD